MIETHVLLKMFENDRGRTTLPSRENEKWTLDHRPKTPLATKFHSNRIRIGATFSDFE